MAILIEKLWFMKSESNKLHNEFADYLQIKYDSSKSEKLSGICLPELEINEKLFILREATAFVGAAGANFCTFFDWQGNEKTGNYIRRL